MSSTSFSREIIRTGFLSRATQHRPWWLLRPRSVSNRTRPCGGRVAPTIGWCRSGHKDHVDVGKAHKLIPTGMRRTRQCTRVRSWTMCSISPTPARRSGRTAPTARQVEARLKEKGLSSRTTGAPYAIVLCQSARSRRTRRARRCAPVSSSHRWRQDRAHHRHRAGEVQDRDDEPRLQHPPAGSARAAGGCAGLSALTGGVRAASRNGARGRQPGIKTAPDRGLTWARALHSFAQLRQNRQNQLLLFEVPCSSNY
jgi:hypothetical protein